MRGGTANCTIVLFAEPIGSPVVDNPTALVAMNLPSLDKFEHAVAHAGTIVVNSSVIARPTKRSDVTGLSVPANDIAVSLGSSRAANMVALGALIRATEIVPLEMVKRTMVKMLSNKDDASIISVNEQALDAGYSAV